MQRINERLISWASILEDETRRQAEKASQLPFIHPHIALMPDAHLGKGATVGSVIPTRGAIIPAAVGVDIGCGMAAVRTQYHRDDLRGGLTGLRTAIEQAVPLSAGAYNTRLTDSARQRVERLTAEAETAGFDPGQYAKNWALQLGTLGSGNHFIEVCHDEKGAVWLFLHSGSRGVGNKIASHHIRVAQTLIAGRGVTLPDRDLAYLEEGTAEFDAYLRELRWAQDFALANRDEMMDRVAGCFAAFLGGPVEQRERVQCHHNYTERETHYGETVWLSRKGAINAAKGVAGLIPGSMGDASYVVVGKGNPAALHSSPHGAGRAYSRTRARKTFTRDQLRTAMKGIEFRDTDAFLDEIPQAYKPIDVVMRDADDLVEIRHTLRQLVNVKGD
ncbi:RNA-splicing ligase RtcB [Actinoplanes philippinensis]|uniref:3'-phosphate/5'-hydroxy nucleic acid ligase n=1 Tax=Actinoplanes philippinensis TaxID=35752 RepID=A0A1I2LTP3_9ACTN|nr:RtcB family protein [Actinoplanes philippinensis]GIE82259.1 RNA-splicing ligase RtcB [Actinoplanes philippinensis]SFF82634.1 tRNA-splicing ligase RtcB [Actinoplanes philippinensis]